MRFVLVRIAAALAVLALLQGAARAQEADLERARSHFDKGQSLYQAGEYEKAAVEFESAYQARPFPQFLFNTAACYEKARRYEEAISYYRRYLEEQKGASDGAATEKRIRVLEKELERIGEKAEPKEGEEKEGEPEPDPEPSAEVRELGEARIRGLVVIVSDPPKALIYLDDRKGQPIGKTPWNGTLQGEHTVYLEREGYKRHEKVISPSPDKLLVLSVGLAEEDYLGWLKISSNVPGAEIYLDNKEAGVFRKTPWQGELEPGPHQIWVTKDGYDEFYTEIEIVRGQTHSIEAKLEGAPVGYVTVRGDVDQASVYLDGELLCERAPCREAVPEGSHTITVKRAGYKPYKHRVSLRSQTELTIKPRLAEQPSRSDAIIAYAFSGVFFGAGIWAGLQAQSLRDELKADIAAGMPPPSANDPRSDRALYFAIGADTAYAIGSISLLMAVYYTFRDKGPPSTGATDLQLLSAEPKVGPGYVGMEVSW